MSKPLFIEPEAEADIAEAYNWYQRQREGLGEDFHLCLDAAFAAIAMRPRAFPKVHGNFRRAVMRRFPYLIFFLDTREGVFVFGVFHGRRDPSTWIERLS